MKSSDKKVLIAVGGLAAIVALWFGVIAPKRAELGGLNDEVSSAQAAVSEQEQLATAAAGAKDSYESDYRELITLGKAVPADADSSSLIDQIDGLAADAGVEFIGLELSEGGGDSDAAQVTPPPALAAPENAVQGEDGGDTTAEGEAPATATAAPATETAAATLPLGATVGAAGLPVMGYALTFRGSFFEVADFLAALDGMVRTGPDGVTVNGRLLTIDSFEVHPDENPDEARTGELAVDLEVTSYVAPADQGLAAGASPVAPATGAPATTTAAPGAAPTPTAAVTAPTP